MDSKRARPPIPSGVWALGLVSLFMDVSSEMIHALLPVFLVTVLGTSVTTVGVLEGIAEATASITKVFSGTWSDRLGKRKTTHIAATGAKALFTGNVGCLMQITRHLRAVGPDVWCAHPVDALWASYSGELPEELNG